MKGSTLYRGYEREKLKHATRGAIPSCVRSYKSKKEEASWWSMKSVPRFWSLREHEYPRFLAGEIAQFAGGELAATAAEFKWHTLGSLFRGAWKVKIDRGPVDVSRGTYSQHRHRTANVDGPWKKKRAMRSVLGVGQQRGGGAKKLSLRTAGPYAIVARGHTPSLSKRKLRKLGREERKSMPFIYATDSPFSNELFSWLHWQINFEFQVLQLLGIPS